VALDGRKAISTRCIEPYHFDLKLGETDMLFTKRAFAIAIGLFVIGILGASDVSAQMGGGAAYSDIWMVAPSSTNQAIVHDEDAEISGYYVVGAGVTDESYNNYGHQTYVSTTLTSPSYNTSNASGGSGGSYSQVETTLDFDFPIPDLGDYTVDSEHSYYCPIADREFSAGHTLDLIGYGISQTCHVYAFSIDAVDWYDRV
jgi:hypothetical protein